MAKKNKNNVLGQYLQESRKRCDLSQADVAKKLGLESPQSISDWERGHGSSIPIPALKKLIKLYAISEAKVYDLLFEYQKAKLEEKIHFQFYGTKKRA